MNRDLLDELLNEGEGSTLDVKRMIHWTGATEEQRSEVLKDVLAMANAFRRSDAYILVGVDEGDAGPPHVIVGFDQHIDDGELQQYINTKTNRPVEFKYETFDVDSKRVGVFHIPLQPRPLFATKVVGKVRGNEVYYRLGSSTAVATPDVIARMVTTDAAVERSRAEQPTLNIEFANDDATERLGDTMEVRARRGAAKKSYPRFSEISDPWARAVAQHLDRGRSDYWTKLAEYVQQLSWIRPIRFVVGNVGGNVARNARVVIGGNVDESMAFELAEVKSPPQRSSLPDLSGISGTGHRSCDVSRRAKTWEGRFKLGDIQAGDTVWTDEPLFISWKQSGERSLAVSIFADNLPAPLKFSLTLRVTVEAVGEITLPFLKKFDGIGDLPYDPIEGIRLLDASWTGLKSS